MKVTLLPTDNPAKPQTAGVSRQATVESEKKRLFKAAKEFESLFMFQLIKSMRETVPENSLSEGFGLSGGMGKDVFTQMFDQELASMMAGRKNNSLAGILYKSMERLVEAQFASHDNESNAVVGDLPTQNYIKIKQEEDSSRMREIAPRNSRGREVPSVSSEYDIEINRTARKYEIEPELLRAMVKAESNFNPEAVSTAGAKGLMQLIDSTATDMGVQNVFDPVENLEGGAKYMRRLLDQFGDTKLALAAYNAGPGTVKRYGGVPPYPETREYIKNIMSELPARETPLK